MDQTKPRSSPPLLVKTQRNDVIRAIEKVGLDPRDFHLANTDTEFRIKHKGSGSFYVIGGHPGAYLVRSLVGDNVEVSLKFYTWDALLPHYKIWAQVVKNDLETPDLWAELQRENHLLEVGSSDVDDNTPFTPDEQNRIAERLHELEKSVKQTHALSAAQELALEKKVDDLIDASRRLGRKDWLSIFIGVFLSLALAAAVDPASARTLFLTALRSIGLLYPEIPFDT